MRRIRQTLYALLLGYVAGSATPARATDFYVVPEGPLGGDGAGWATAFTNIQAAIAAAATGGDRICLKYGIYTNSPEIVISDHPGLTLEGGFLGVGTPGAITSSPSILTRGSELNRICFATNSTLTLNRLTITNGYALNGAGLYLIACQTVITNCSIRENASKLASFTPTGNGIGLYANGGTLGVFNSDISKNVGVTRKFGAGLRADGVALTLNTCTLTDNELSGSWDLYGAGLLLSGGSATLENCTFTSNNITGGTGKYGGCIYASGVNPLTLSNCTFQGNFVGGSTDGGVLYVTGAGSTLIDECRFQKNNTALISPVVEDIFLNSTGPTVIRNTLLSAGGNRGIFKQASGTLTLTNCLIRAMGSHALVITAGNMTLANSTLAGTMGCGITNTSSGTITLIDSLVWDNAAGGVTGGTINATYCNLQEPRAGTGNLTADPLFVAGTYLSASTLPFQSANSPCIDAGSASAASLNLGSRTTRTDGGLDQEQVDIGFHATSGTSISNLLLYVDVVNGDNANTGWTPSAAKKNLSSALTNTLDGATIHIAAGNYTVAAGETFPLSPQNLNLTLCGTNPTLTRISANGVTRVFEADSLGALRLEGLSFTNGAFVSGAGLYLKSCQTVITNCIIARNTCAGNSVGNQGFGIGLYVLYGSLQVFDSEISRNTGATYQHGQGLYASSANIVLKGCTIASNTASGSYTLQGGGLYLSGGSAVLENCRLLNNTCQGGNSMAGGALLASAVSPLTVTNCTFIGNYAAGGNGGVLSLSGASAALITGCQILSNANATTLQDVYINSTAPVTFWNTLIGKGSKTGITKLNTGLLAITNGLIFGQPSHGIQITAGSAAIGNTTVADNSGWGISNSVGTVSVLNSIVWNNTSGGVTNCTVSYSDIQDSVVAGSGNISSDPKFTSAIDQDYRLNSGSPCKNNGSTESWMASGQDLAGNKRAMGVVDMGAFESSLGQGIIFIFY